MVVHEYYPKDIRVRREAEALIDKGYSLDVICLKTPDERFESVWNKVKIHRLPIKRHRGSPLIIYLLEYFNFSFFALFRLMYLYFQKRFDIIHIHNPPDFLIFTAIIPKLFGARIILDIHDRVPLLYLSRFGLHKDHPIIHFVKFIEKMSINFADKLIVAVNTYKEMFIKIGIPANKIEVVLNTADEKYFYPHKSRNVIKNKRLKLFHHGTLLKRYGTDILIKAIGMIKEKGLDFSLDIYGEGDFETHLKKLIKRLKLEKNVFLKGFAPWEFLPEEIAKADLGIIPNLKDKHVESALPTKLFEYIVMEKPVIISKTRGVYDYFSEKEVTYFEPGNIKELAQKILAFKRNPEPFLRKIPRAKKKYKKISWDNQKKVLFSIYQNLIN